MSVPLEIACDESGSEGEKVVGGTTRMFAHASVDIDVALAAGCIVELRGRTRSPAEEYKASVVLRTQNRSALVWLLGDGGLGNDALGTGLAAFQALLLTVTGVVGVLALRRTVRLLRA